MRWFWCLRVKIFDVRVSCIALAGVIMLSMYYSWVTFTNTSEHVLGSNDKNEDTTLLKNVHESEFFDRRSNFKINPERLTGSKENLRYHKDRQSRREPDTHPIVDGRVPRMTKIGKSNVAWDTIKHVDGPSLDSFDLYEKANYTYSEDDMSYVVNYPKATPEAFKEKLPLEVIFIKHSHIDPGWLFTADEYFNDQVTHILDNMLKYLTMHKEMKYIWAETVYFSRWYENLDSMDKSKVSKLLENGQLEMVTGGWVMPDEACTHYAAIIDQLIEGHQWLLHNLKVKPKHNWSVDPFGHSATATYLWKLAGFNMMVVQRIHQAVKNYLLAHKNLQFNWRQRWDKQGTTDMLVYTDPWTYYVTGDSCGPQNSECDAFDLVRDHMLPERLEEPGGLRTFAMMLYNQLMHKALLYKQNVILVMLGGDFEGVDSALWEKQQISFLKLFRHLNSNPEYKINIKFGTVNDYAESFIRRSENIPHYGLADFRGDFFPYSIDRNEQWTGFFTTKPNSKRLSRDLQENLRASSILNTFASVSTKLRVDHHSLLLQNARREMGVFQHHDAITGTSKQRVSNDYDRRLTTGLNHTQYVMYRAASSLLSIRDSTRFSKQFSLLDNIVKPQVSVIYKLSHKCIALFNPLERTQSILVTIINAGSKLSVTNENNEVMNVQVLPNSFHKTSLSKSQHVMFKAVLPPLGIAVYLLSDQLSDNARSYSTLKKVSNATKTIALANKCYKINFDQNSGSVKSIRLVKHNITYKVSIDFELYRSDYSSGLYLFTLGELAGIDKRHTMKKLDGKLMSSVTTRFLYLTHRISLLHSDDPDECGAIRIDNVAFLKEFDNIELIMTIRTDVRSGDTFFVDSNGFQIAERRRIKQLRDAFYPMTNMMYIEDNSLRVTIHSRQALGASSLKPGSLNVLLDRTMDTDDNKGAGEGVVENPPAHSTFLLDIEPKLSYKGQYTNTNGHNSVPLPSLRAIDINDRLQTPIVPISFYKCDAVKLFYPLNKTLPCYLKLVNVRDLYPQSELREYGVTIQRWAYNSDTFSNPKQCLDRNDISLCDFFPICPKRAIEMSLSFIHEYNSVNPQQILDIGPMEIKSYKVSW